MKLPKPYWQSKMITLYRGDCLEIMPALRAESFDIIWTDPPYGHNNNQGDLNQVINIALGRSDKKKDVIAIANDSAVDMRRVVDGMLVQAARVLKRDCCCCCCCCCGGGPRPTFAWLAQRMDSGGLSFFHSVIWDKVRLGLGWRFRRNHEMVMVAHRRGGKLKWEHKGHGKETANVVRIPRVHRKPDDHPTPKPIDLPFHFLSLFGKVGDRVLDPFCGSGTTLIAARRLGMRAVGIELERRWLDKAVERLEAEG